MKDVAYVSSIICYQKSYIICFLFFSKLSLVWLLWLLILSHHSMCTRLLVVLLLSSFMLWCSSSLVLLKTFLSLLGCKPLFHEEVFLLLNVEVIIIEYNVLHVHPKALISYILKIKCMHLYFLTIVCKTKVNIFDTAYVKIKIPNIQ